MFPLLFNKQRFGCSSGGRYGRRYLFLATSGAETKPIDRCLKQMVCYPEDEVVCDSVDEWEDVIPSFAAAFSNVDPHIFATADEDGVVKIFDSCKTLKGNSLSAFIAHENAIFQIAWAPSEPWLVTASGDQTAALWDTPTSVKKAEFKKHTCSLKSVSFGHQNNFVIGTGSRDGSILIWDLRAAGRTRGHPSPVLSIAKAHENEALSKLKPRRRRKMSDNMLNVDPMQSVTSLLFQTDKTILSTGAADGKIKLWDLRCITKKKPKKNTASAEPSTTFYYNGASQRNHGFAGYTSLLLDSTRSRFFANCTDSVVYAYDCHGSNREPVAEYKGHNNSTFYIKSALSPDDLFLISGSSDSQAYIWKVAEPDRPPMRLKGHEGEVTSPAWCSNDITKIVTCADDCTVRLWRMHHEGNQSQDKPIGETEWEEPPSTPPKLAKSLSCPAKIRPQPSSTTSSRCSTPSPIGTRQSTPKVKRSFSLKEWITPKQDTGNVAHEHSETQPSRSSTDDSNSKHPTVVDKNDKSVECNNEDDGNKENAINSESKDNEKPSISRKDEKQRKKTIKSLFQSKYNHLRIAEKNSASKQVCNGFVNGFIEEKINSNKTKTTEILNCMENNNCRTDAGNANCKCIRTDADNGLESEEESVTKWEMKKPINKRIIDSLTDEEIESKKTLDIKGKENRSPNIAEEDCGDVLPLEEKARMPHLSSKRDSKDLHTADDTLQKESSFSQEVGIQSPASQKNPLKRRSQIQDYFTPIKRPRSATD